MNKQKCFCCFRCVNLVNNYQDREGFFAFVFTFLTLFSFLFLKLCVHVSITGTVRALSGAGINNNDCTICLNLCYGVLHHRCLFCFLSTQLVLKHRQGKNHKMRIIVFVGSPVEADEKDVSHLKMLLELNE